MAIRRMRIVRKCEILSLIFNRMLLHASILCFVQKYTGDKISIISLRIGSSKCLSKYFDSIRWRIKLCVTSHTTFAYRIEQRMHLAHLKAGLSEDEGKGSLVTRCHQQRCKFRTNIWNYGAGKDRACVRVCHDGPIDCTHTEHIQEEKLGAIGSLRPAAR